MVLLGVLLGRPDDFRIRDEARRVGENPVLDEIVVLNKRRGVDHRTDDLVHGGPQRSLGRLAGRGAVPGGYDIDKLDVVLRNRRKGKKNCRKRRKEECGKQVFHG